VKERRIRKNKKKSAGPNNWIYITGLPSDCTVDEVKLHFSKVGLIALNPLDQQSKIKLYYDANGLCKGDCSLCYNAKESVDVAINVLDLGYIRPSNQVNVTKAEFILKEGGGGGGNIKDVNSTTRSNITQAQVKVAQAGINNYFFLFFLITIFIIIFISTN
jgi:RNA recognition motif-containing protein